MRRLAPALAPLSLTAMTVALGLPALTWPANTLDEMILLVYPMRMLDGDLPYRDFFAAYGPAHWWLLEGLSVHQRPLVIATASTIPIATGMAVRAIDGVTTAGGGGAGLSKAASISSRA